MRTKTFQFILLLLLLLSYSQQLHSQKRIPQPKSLTAEQIATKFLPSVVVLICDDGKGNFSQGSGFFIKNGMILTNHHVIKGMVRGKVKTVVGENQSKEWWIEKILHIDSKNDLALIQIKETDKNSIPILKLSNSQIKTGQKIYVLSNPKGLTGTISQGIISSGIRKINDTELIQIDAPISSGSSGGAVLNSFGEVIGIATSSLSDGQNLNFAVPSTLINPFVNEYDKQSNSLVFGNSLFQNGWKERTLKSILSNKKLNYAEITNLLVKAINDSQESLKISFTQCETNIIFRKTGETFSIQVGDNNVKVNPESQKIWDIDFSTMEDTTKSTIQNNLVFKSQIYSNPILEYRNAEKTIYSLKRITEVPFEGIKELSEVAYLFTELTKVCKSNQIDFSKNQNTIQEDANKIKKILEKISITSYYSEKTYYEVQFSNCSMVFIKRRFRPNQSTKIQEIYKLNVKDIREVKIDPLFANSYIGWDKPSWGVNLWLNQKSIYVEESQRNGSFESKNKESYELFLYFNNLEDANQVASTFFNLIEKCNFKK